MRKVIIIPHEKYNSTMINAPPPDNPEYRRIFELEKQLKNILESDAPPASKNIEYQQVLQRYIEHVQSVRQAPASYKESSTSSPPPPPAPATEQLQSVLQQTLPKSTSKKGLALYELLKHLPSDRIQWDDQGKVQIHGQPIDGHIIDHIANAVSSVAKKKEPRGWEKFRAFAVQNNIPSTLFKHRDPYPSTPSAAAAIASATPTITPSTRGIGKVRKPRERDTTHYNLREGIEWLKL